MNVKTKISDRSITPVASSIVMFVFLILPLIIISVFVKMMFELYTNAEIEILYSLVPVFIIFAFFLIIGFILLFYLLKKPKKYKAKLLHRKQQLYKNKYIIRLGFDIYDKNLKKHYSSKYNSDEKEKADFWCYTVEQDNLSIGKDYYVYIKEFNWSIKRIEECMESQNDI